MDALDALLDIAAGREPVYATTNSEDTFINNLTAGSAPKIANLIHFVRHQVYLLDHFHSHGVHIMKASLDTMRRATWREQIAVLIEYYLLMHHGAPFEAGSGAPQCDLKVVVEKLMNTDSVKNAIPRVKLG